jgi:diamine N-acetyltransferase
MLIRVASESDVAELSAIGSKVFWDAYGGTAPDEDIEDHVSSFFSEEYIQNEIVRHEVTYHMAVENDRCAGLIKVRDSKVPELIDAAATMEVQQLYVSTDFQRRGIGALLLDEAVTTAKNRGVDGVWLSVWEDADWATSFYDKYGFTSKGDITFVLASTEYTDHLMWLPVGD